VCKKEKNTNKYFKEKGEMKKKKKIQDNILKIILRVVFKKII